MLCGVKNGEWWRGCRAGWKGPSHPLPGRKKRLPIRPQLPCVHHGKDRAQNHLHLSAQWAQKIPAGKPGPTFCGPAHKIPMTKRAGVSVEGVHKIPWGKWGGVLLCPAQGIPRPKCGGNFSEPTHKVPAATCHGVLSCPAHKVPRGKTSGLFSRPPCKSPPASGGTGGGQLTVD